MYDFGLCNFYSVINSSSRTTQLHTNIMKGVGYWVNEDGDLNDQPYRLNFASYGPDS